MLLHASYCSSLAAVSDSTVSFWHCIYQCTHSPISLLLFCRSCIFLLPPPPDPTTTSSLWNHFLIPHTWHTSLFVQQHWTFLIRKGERELKQISSVSKWIKKHNEYGCTAYLKARTEEPTCCFCPYCRWFGKIAGSSIRQCALVKIERWK